MTTQEQFKAFYQKIAENIAKSGWHLQYVFDHEYMDPRQKVLYKLPN